MCIKIRYEFINVVTFGVGVMVRVKVMVILVFHDVRLWAIAACIKFKGKFVKG